MTSEAEIVYPGEANGRQAIELRVHPDGTNEAYLVPMGAAPVPTGIELTKSGSKYKIQCRIRNKLLAFKPEEVVRQFVLNKLIDDLGYEETQIDVEVSVQMGSAVHNKLADIVIYDDAKKTQHSIIIEVKKPNRKDGVDQLKSYMNSTGAPLGYWTDGVDEKFLLRVAANDFSKPIWRLPKQGESLDDIDEPLTKEKLTPVKDLYSVFKEIEQEILAHQTVDTFNEIFKIVFAKLYDERVNLKTNSTPVNFRVGMSEKPTSASKRIKKLFKDAKKKWKSVYNHNDEIELSDKNIAYCVQSLQQYHLIQSGDVLGVAFELLVNKEMKGDMGQFFTPRQVVDMMVKMMNPSITETVLDPACGSGGFLIYSLRSIYNYIDLEWDNADDRAEQRKDYAQSYILGIDNDPRLVQVAKAYMIMENDGRSGVHFGDALDYDSWKLGLKEAIVGRDLAESDLLAGHLVDSRTDDDGVDIILTNPPFAGAIKANSTLRQYSLSFDDKNKLRKEVVRAKLFVERCIDMLRPGGRMGIVLPQGLFNNFSDEYVRNFIGEKCRILAVIGLHPYTFKPFTLAKTSVLFVQKWDEENAEDDYEIFTAVSMKPGKTKLGRPQYQDDGVTLDCDMSEIADEFIKWAKVQSLEFI